MNFKAGFFRSQFRLMGAHNFRPLSLIAVGVVPNQSKTNYKSLLTTFNFDLISCWLGSDFLCATHIIPVKNEEGVVMMFILNFDYILDEGSSDSLERLNHTSPSKADQCE